MSQYKALLNDGRADDSLDLKQIEALVAELSKSKPNDRVLKNLSDRCQLQYSKDHVSMMATVLDLLNSRPIRQRKSPEV